MNMKDFKSQKGITLLALGITIVILLILAGITMNMLTGDHGMIDEATNAAIQSETAKVHEDWGLYIKSQDLKRIKEHDFSEPTVKEDLSGIVTEVTTSDGYNLGIIKDFARLEIDSDYGKGAKDVSASFNKKMEDLDDVFAIDFDTNKTYYIKDGRMWSVGGEVSAADVEQDHKESQTKNIIINRVIYKDKKLDVLTATISPPETPTANVDLTAKEATSITLKVGSQEVVMDPYAWSLTKNIDPNDAEIDGTTLIEPNGTATGLKEDTTYYMIYKGKIERDLTKPDGSKEHVEQDVYGTPSGDTAQETLPSPAAPSQDPNASPDPSAPTVDPMAPPSSWTDPEQQPTPGQGETPKDDGEWHFEGWTNGTDPSAPVVDPTDPNLPPDADLHAKYSKTVTVKRIVYENSELEELTGVVYRNDVTIVPATINLKSTASISINVNGQSITAEPRGWSTDPRPSAVITVPLNGDAKVTTSTTFHASYKYSTKYKYVDPETGAETEKDKDIYVGSDGKQEGNEPLEFPSNPPAPGKWGEGWEFKGWSKDEDPSKQDQIVDPNTEVPNPDQVYHPTYAKKITIHRYEKGPKAVADVTGTAYQNEKKKELAHINIGTVDPFQTSVQTEDGSYYQADPYAWYKGDPAPHKGEIDNETLFAPNTVIDTETDGESFYMNYKYTKKVKYLDPSTGEQKEGSQDVYVGSNGEESQDPIKDENGETLGGETPEDDPDHTKNVSPEKKEEGYKQETGTGKEPDNIEEGHNVWTTDPNDPSNPEKWVDPLNPDPNKPVDPNTPLHPVLYKEVQAKTHEFESVGHSKETDLGKKKVYSTNQEYVEPAAFELGTAKQISFQYKERQQIANPRHWSTEKKGQSPEPSGDETKANVNAVSVKNGGIAYLTQDADYYMSYSFKITVNFTTSGGDTSSKEETVFVDSEGNVTGDENFTFPDDPSPDSPPKDSGKGPNDGTAGGNTGGKDPENPDGNWEPNGWVNGTDPSGEVVDPSAPDFVPDPNGDYHYTWKRTVTAKMYIYKNQALADVTGTAYKNDVKEVPAEIQLATAEKTTITEGDYNVQADPRHWSVDKSPTAAEPNPAEKWNENAVANGGVAHLINNQTYYMSYKFTVKLKYKAQDGSEKEVDQNVFVGSDGTVSREEVTVPEEDKPQPPAGTEGFEPNKDDPSNENPNNPGDVEDPDKYTGHDLWTTDPTDPGNKDKWVDPLDPNLKLQDGQTIYPVFRKKIVVHKHVLPTEYYEDGQEHTEQNKKSEQDEHIIGYSYVSTEAQYATLAEINLGKAHDVEGAPVPEHQGDPDIAKPRHWSTDKSSQSAEPDAHQEAKNETAVNMGEAVHISQDNSGLHAPDDNCTVAGKDTSTKEVDYYMSYWYDINIEFNANGGEGDVPDTITQRIFQDSEGQTTEYKHKFEESQKTPTRDGYTFLGWSMNQLADHADPSMVVGQEGTFNSSCILYAIWDGQGPTIDMSPEGSFQYKQKQDVKVTITSVAGIEISQAKYVWTQSAKKPGNDDESFKEKEKYFENTLDLQQVGDTNSKKEGTASLEGKTGKDWYLWVYAEDVQGHVSIETAGIGSPQAFYMDNQAPNDDAPECVPTLVTITATLKQKDEHAGINVDGKRTVEDDSSHSLEPQTKEEDFPDGGISWGIKNADLGGDITWVRTTDKSTADPYTFTDLQPDTNYEIYTKVADNAGNGPVQSQAAECKTSAIATPEIAITPDTWTQGNVSVTITQGEGGGAGTKLQYTETPDQPESWQDYTSGPISIDHNCTITARNVTEDLKYGTDKTASKDITIIDRQAPKISSIEVDKLHVTVKVSDPGADEKYPGSGVSAKALTMEDNLQPGGRIYESVDPKTEEQTFEFDATQGGTWYLYFIDQAKNFVKQELTLTNTDLTGPTISIEPETNLNWQKAQEATVTVTGTETANPVVGGAPTNNFGVNEESLKYLWNDDGVTVPDKGDFKDTFQNSGKVTLSGDTEPGVTGTKYLWIYAEDTRGNSTIKASQGFNLDNTSPDDTKPLAEANISTVTVTSQQQDANSGVDPATRAYSMRKCPDGAWQEWVTDPEDTHTFENLDLNSEYEFRTKVADKAGNAETESEPEKAQTKKISTPIISAKPEGSPDGKWTNGEVTVTITYSKDQDLTNKYCIDGEHWLDYPKDGSITIKENNTKVQAKSIVTSNDKYQSEVAERTIDYIDTTSPEVTRFSYVTLNMTAEAEDHESKIVKYKFSQEENVFASDRDWQTIDPAETIHQEKKADATGPWFFHVMNGAGGITSQKVMVDGALGPMTGEVTPEDYGDNVDIGQDLNGDGDTTNDWVIFYRNKQYTYLIAKEYLASSQVPAGAGMTANGTHAVYWGDLTGNGSSDILETVADKFMLNWRASNPASTINSAKAVAKLLNIDTWNKFSSASEGPTGLTGIQAVGSPTVDMWTSSWNQVETTKLSLASAADGYSVNPTALGSGAPLYFPTGGGDATGYWLASPSASSQDKLLVVDNASKALGDALYSADTFAVRPVIALPEDAIGTKDDQDVWKPSNDPDKALEPTIVFNSKNWATSTVATVRWPAEEGLTKKYSTDPTQTTWQDYTGPVTITANGKFSAKAIREGATDKIVSEDVTWIDDINPTLGDSASVVDHGRVSATISVTAEDPQSGLAQYLIDKNATAVKNVGGWQDIEGYSQGNGVKGEKTISADVTENGNWYIHVIDAAGNIANKQAQVTTIDEVDPTIVSFEAGSSVGADGNIQLLGKAYDNESGLVGWQVTTSSSLADESQGWTAIEPLKISDSTDPYVMTFNVQASGTYYLHVKDAKGHITHTPEGQGTQVQDTFFDNIAPQITVTPGGWAKEKQLKIQYANIAGLENKYVVFSNTESLPDESTWTPAGSNPVETTLETNNVKIHANSKLTKDQQRYVEVEETGIDPKEPVEVNLIVGEKQEAGGKYTVELTGQAKDNESGIAKYQFVKTSLGTENTTPGDGDWKNIDSPDSNKGTLITQKETVELNGTYFFFVQDQAGNVSSFKNDVTSLDSEPPKVTTYTQSGGANGKSWTWNEGQATTPSQTEDTAWNGKITATVTDNMDVAGYYFSLNGEVPSDGDYKTDGCTGSSVTVELPEPYTASNKNDGRHTFQLYVKDSSGNSEKYPIYYQSDWTGPTVSENSFKYDSTNKRLEAVITDNLSGVKDVLFTTKQTVDETDWSTASQYYEKDTSSDNYYSKGIIVTSRYLVFSCPRLCD